MKFLISLWLVVLVACAEDTASPSSTDGTQARTGTRSSSERASSSRDQGGIDIVESAQRNTAGGKVSRASADAGAATPPRSGQAQAGHGGNMSKASTASSSAMRAAHQPSDSAMPTEASSDAGIEADIHDIHDINDSARDTDAGPAASAPHHDGSCCVASALPGCGDPALQACVCALAPECCTIGWSESCTFIVTQRYCQPGVRECVCGSAEGQWQQAYCCGQSWTDTCESVAVNKCAAATGCS